MSVPESAPPRASVIVCTRNRSRDLVRACEAALRCRAGFAWELWIVDNLSDDDTLEVARALADAHPGRAHVAVERELGLSAARNLGVRLARGEWLAFLDDDAAPAPGWLEAYDRLFAETAALAAGGPVDPDFAGEPPAWFGPTYHPYVSAWDRGTERHRLAYNEFPRGANIAFRRAAFDRVGFFDRRLGRRGRSLRSCEEIELCLRLDRSGGEVLYEPEARVRHRVEADRLTPAWLLDRFAAQGFSEAIVEWKHGGLAGLREGLRRLRTGVRAWRERAGAESLDARCHQRGLRAYRQGALYAVFTISRWRPGADPAGALRNLRRPH